jgi:GTP cyclohydrolase I
MNPASPTPSIDPSEDILLEDETLDLPEERTAAAVREILAAIGEDPQRNGLLKTPARVARMYAEITGGYRTDPAKLVNDALFEVDYQEMVW